MTGDIIDRKTKSLQDVFHLIEEITSFQKHVYFVSGNHEWGNNLRNELLTGLEQREVQILNNTSAEIMINGMKLNLVGIDDVSTNHEDMKKAFTNVNNQEYTVLLSHSPSVTDKYFDIDADLILSGHTHGGQVRLPLIGPIIAPDEGLFPKKTKGVYQLKRNQHLYIDSGLGTSLLPVRFLNKSQLSVIEITD
ncbi:metallophosphoesterase [Oceanobacillus sp. 1P07AA]|uniref:metallophosphoesterase n=1 Tax=Oceanobacillus sp. 1P07AA TaxID=3132293 RepID=UPI0039A72A49